VGDVRQRSAWNWRGERSGCSLSHEVSIQQCSGDSDPAYSLEYYVDKLNIIKFKIENYISSLRPLVAFICLTDPQKVQDMCCLLLFSICL
jgi:hypothetical protein